MGHINVDADAVWTIIRPILSERLEKGEGTIGLANEVATTSSAENLTNPRLKHLLEVVCKIASPLSSSPDAERQRLLTLVADCCCAVWLNRMQWLSHYPDLASNESVSKALLLFILGERAENLSELEQKEVMGWFENENCRKALYHLPFPWWNDIKGELTNARKCHGQSQGATEPFCWHVVARVRQRRSSPAIYMSGTATPPTTGFIASDMVFETTHRSGNTWTDTQHEAVWSWLADPKVLTWQLKAVSAAGLGKEDAEDAVATSHLRFGDPLCYHGFKAALVAFLTWYRNGPLKNAAACILRHRGPQQATITEVTDSDREAWMLMDYQLLMEDVAGALRKAWRVTSQQRCIGSNICNHCSSSTPCPCAKLVVAVTDGMLWVLQAQGTSETRFSGVAGGEAPIISSSMLGSLLACVLTKLTPEQRKFLASIGEARQSGYENSSDIAPLIGLEHDAMRQKKSRMARQLKEAIQSCNAQEGSVL